VLENLAVGIEKNGEVISLVGVEDPSFETDYLFGDANAVMSEQLNALATNEWFTVLLSHRPELFSCYAEHEIDLVLSGHAHGGQMRPLGIALYAPGQGIFPKYTGGVHDGRLIISRGLSNHVRLPRFWNPPELVCLELVPHTENTL
jgi:predicted MPP superfamily phosphohydrolase